MPVLRCRDLYADNSSCRLLISGRLHRRLIPASKSPGWHISYADRLVTVELRIAGQRVSGAIVGFTVAFRLGSDSDFEVQIEGGIELRAENGDALGASSEKYDEIRPEIESLIGSTIISATADDSGLLSIEFDSKVQLRVPADGHYEAWNVVGPGGYRIVCLPGGELAIWSARVVSRNDPGNRAAIDWDL